ncbi:DNA adenine methylase [Paenibacillus sp. FSL R7-0302]|uniref:DNA adenine methylase n=1 Tax=Paenibacillus sp. FSL R7-0302 TaxID=2921681 RepID=UPI0030F66CAE
MTLIYDDNVPHIIKYMGSKRKILNQVIEAINSVYNTGDFICDLFAGTSVLSGALRNSAPMISNDIQQYSKVLAKAYLSDYDWSLYPDIVRKMIAQAEDHISSFRFQFPQYNFQYNSEMSLERFNILEHDQQSLINQNFEGHPYHLYAKNYSGTYWSYDQCLWIDALRAVLESYKEHTALYYSGMASLMFAMSYTSQSTGHYAQYRDARSEASKNDILSYRMREIAPLFERKMVEFQQQFGKQLFNHLVYAEDYRDCLELIPNRTTVYADPPYCFVHYSRFYHAIETLVRYDYPVIEHKGRYRNDRHQSPFCIKSQVEEAFQAMFQRVRESEGQLVLSYSNTGMIELPDLLELANDSFGVKYKIEPSYFEYVHSTMGRKEDKSRDVQEAIIVVRRREL